MINANQNDAQMLQRYIKYLEYTPDNINLLQDSLALAINLQDWDTANAIASQALEHYPKDPAINAHAGMIALRNNNIESATGYLQYAVEGGITDAAVIYNLATALYFSRNFESATETLSTIDPNVMSTDAIILKARCLHNLDQIAEAIALLSHLLKSQPDNDQVLGALAILSVDYGQIPQAIEYANACLAINQNNHDALLARGESRAASQKYDLAFSDFEHATQVSNASGRAWSGMGQIHFHRFELDKAIDAIGKAVETMPDHIGTWHLLGWAYLGKNEIEQAEQAFEKAYALDRNFAETHGSLASVYALKNEVEKAEKHIKIAQRLAPQGFAHIYAQMVLLNKQGKGQAARDLFDKTQNTYVDVLGTSPKALIQARLAELYTNTSSDQIN